MACFVAPAAEAIATAVIKKTVDKNMSEKVRANNPFVKRLNWLNNMLWGGSALLAFEHLWHGEIAPVFPFLTGTDALREIATSGVGMAMLVTAVWGAMAAVAASIEKRPAEAIEK